MIEPNESAVSLSLDDLTSFGPPLESSGLPGGHEQSFDDGTTSFLSGTDISHDTFDLVGDSTSDGYSRRTPSIAGKLSVQSDLYKNNIFIQIFSERIWSRNDLEI